MSDIEIKAGTRLRNTRTGAVVTVVDPPRRGVPAVVQYPNGQLSVLLDLRGSLATGYWLADGSAQVAVEYRLMYQPWDYRLVPPAATPGSKPSCESSSSELHVIESQLQVNVEASGAPEEWWIEKVTTERLSL